MNLTKRVIQQKFFFNAVYRNSCCYIHCNSVLFDSDDHKARVSDHEVTRNSVLNENLNSSFMAVFRRKNHSPKTVPEVFHNFMQKFKNFEVDIIRNDQEFNPNRFSALGPDLGVAHLIVYRSGKIKFAGQNNWLELDDNRKYELPKFYNPNYKVVGIDLTGMDAMDNLFENFGKLNNLEELIIKDPKYLNGNSLQFIVSCCEHLERLELSNIQGVSDEKLAYLSTLRNLKELKLENIQGIQNMELVILLMKDVLPDCKFILDNDVI